MIHTGSSSRGLSMDSPCLGDRKSKLDEGGPLNPNTPGTNLVFPPATGLKKGNLSHNY